jgi:hypothetical protein
MVTTTGMVLLIKEATPSSLHSGKLVQLVDRATEEAN